MSTTVQLGNQTFHYNNTPADHERRTQYFKLRSRSGASLDDAEKEILSSLGIDAAMEETLSPYLADFFKILPQCSSPTALTLNKKCELPYYVLWSVMFANHQMTEKRIAGQGAVPSQLNIVKSASIIDELMPSVSPTFVAPGSATEQFRASASVIQELFTLIVPTTPALGLLTNAVANADEINSVFTLITV